MGCQTTTAIDACGATNTMGIRACGQTALQRTWSLEQLPIVMMLDSRRMSWQRAWKTTRTPVRRGYMLLPLSLLWCSWDDCWAKCCPMRHHGLNPSSFHDHRLALSNPCVISDLGGGGLACLKSWMISMFWFLPLTVGRSWLMNFRWLMTAQQGGGNAAEAWRWGAGCGERRAPYQVSRTPWCVPPCVRMHYK